MDAPTDGNELLGSKASNYQFLKLVREKKFREALKLGKQILSVEPNNPSVARFVAFLEQNSPEAVAQVVDDSDSGSGDSDEEEDDDGKPGSNEDDKEDENDDKEESSQDQEEEEEEQKPIEAPVLSTCTLNPIPHICPRRHKELAKLATQYPTAEKPPETSQ